MSYFTLLFSYQSFLKCSDLANQRAINPGLAEKKIVSRHFHIFIPAAQLKSTGLLLYKTGQSDDIPLFFSKKCYPKELKKKKKEKLSWRICLKFLSSVNPHLLQFFDVLAANTRLNMLSCLLPSVKSFFATVQIIENPIETCIDLEVVFP